MRSVLVCVAVLAFACSAMAALPHASEAQVVHVTPESPAFAMTNFAESQYTAPSPCTYTGGGGTWDLSALYKPTGGGDYTGTDGQYDYKMNVCGTSNSGAGCTDKNYAICQFSQAGGTFVASLGSFAIAPTWSVITLPPAAPEPFANGVQYTMVNGDICWIAGRQQVRTVVSVFRCTPGATEGTVKVEEDQTTCTFTITLKTPVACQGGSSGGGGSPTSGISGGWIFIIILVVCIVVYIGVGFGIGKKRGLAGSEALPQVAFWRDLPSLVKDGAKYTWNMTRSGCKSGKGEQYDAL